MDCTLEAENLNNEAPSHLIELVQEAVERNDVPDVRRLISQFGFYDAHNVALIGAIELNHIDCVRALIPFSAATSQENFVLRLATQLGRAECVKELLVVCKAEDALLEAVECGQIDCLKHIISQCHSHWLQEAFVYAIKKKHPNGVASAQLLLPFADKFIFDGHALTAAANNSTPEMVDFLFDKCNPHRALANLKREHPHTRNVWEHLECKIQAQKIANHLDTNRVTTSRKM